MRLTRGYINKIIKMDQTRRNKIRTTTTTRQGKTLNNYQQKSLYNKTIRVSHLLNPDPETCQSEISHSS